MLIDTHCHLDAAELDGQGAQLAQAARQQGVAAVVIPAVCRDNFNQVASLGQYGGYALGIHPLYVPDAEEADLESLRVAVEAAMQDRHFVAIGEIGLDFFVPELCTPAMRDKQIYFYREQLKIAQKYNLPVLLHVRRSVDQILKGLRQITVPTGIAHAFNGSEQQAGMLIQLGFKLGFGGAMTYTRALQIRRLATSLPLSSIVLETDTPDIPPSWLTDAPNTPAQLARIAEILGELRQLPVSEIASVTTANAYNALPRLAVAMA
jgi:TatD DNase family protein